MGILQVVGIEGLETDGQGSPVRVVHQGLPAPEREL